MKKITLTTITLIAAVFLAACGSDSKSGTARTGTGYTAGQACAGCSNSNRLYTAIGRAPGVDLVMELFAANYTTPVAGVDPTGMGQYGGAVDGIGRLFVATGLSCGFGNAPAIPRGVFDVRVKGFGNMDPYSEVVSGIHAEAIGAGVVIEMRLKSAVFYTSSPQIRGCDGFDYGTEMIGQWEITSVNGFYCGNSVYFDQTQTGSALMCP